MAPIPSNHPQQASPPPVFDRPTAYYLPSPCQATADRSSGCDAIGAIVTPFFAITLMKQDAIA
jgi:hypothetical protein